MILHIFNDQKKFSKGYFQMLHDYNFDLSNMELIHHGKQDRYYSELGLKTRFIRSFFDPIGNLKMIYPIWKADKIIVHCLASPLLLCQIALFPSVGKKVRWVIWGKDLYFFQMLENPRLHHRAYEWLRKRAIKRIPFIISILKEDYELARKWYLTRADHLEMVMLYPYALDAISAQKPQGDKSGGYTVLLGNSASLTNNHIEALEALSYQKAAIKNIICPLSYGGTKAYVKQVIRSGKKIFGDRFVPLTEFMEQSRYFEMLRSVDIGVFNYNRQEGLGNIWSLILAGKTIYMRMPTSTTSFFARSGIRILDIQELSGKRMHTLSAEELKHNAEALRPLISVEASVEKWRSVLE